MNVLVTGATGFVGRALCAHLGEHELVVREACRDMGQDNAAEHRDSVVVGNIGPDTDWHAALEGIDSVVHLAARVHVMQDTASDSLNEYRLVNVEGTRRLALAAAEAGVRRFVFLSSVKVNGESTSRPFIEYRLAESGTGCLRDLEVGSRAGADADRQYTGHGVGDPASPVDLWARRARQLPKSLMRAVARGAPLPLVRWRTGAACFTWVVVHLAARVHVMQDTASDSLNEYRLANVEGARRLALGAAEAGVRRFVFLSSVKVNGESTSRPFIESDRPNPHDAYGISKWEAEQALMQIGKDTGMECVILRPPLIYGPDVRANFLSLMRAVARGVPLPLGALENRRSLLYLGNLVDAIRVCLSHSAAAGQVFLLSDGEDVSTPELVRRLAAALRVRPRLLSVPLPLLRLAGWLTGRAARSSG